MKKITRLCACLITICLAVPTFGQTKLSKQMDRKQEIRKRIAKHRENRNSDFSLFNQMIAKSKTNITSQSLPAAMSKAMRLPNDPMLTARKAVLIGSHLVGDYGEMVTFSPSSTIAFEPLAQMGYDVKFNGGAAIVGDKFYGMSVSEFGGMKMTDLYVYDVNTWTPTTSDPDMIFDKSLLATETAKDPNSTKVFGQFFNGYMNTLEFGFIDYEAKTRTTIKESQNRYVALGYGKDNFAYGVATDGNLYKIDPTTGAETLVGSTGVTVQTGTGQYYEQSGEIDPGSGEFYWAATDANMVSNLYLVDLQTGAATQIGALPDGVLGMVIPGAEAVDGAPDKSTNVTFDFVNEATTGKVTFTAPTTTYAGDALPASALNYVIYANDIKIGEGTTTPGATVTQDITVEAGMNNFVIVVSNAVGDGAKYKESRWVGFDEMYGPDNLTLTRSGVGNKHISLSWTAPSETLHGGYVGTITYNVYRLHNGEETLISSRQSGLTFEEDLVASDFSQYSYIVQTVNGDMPGDYEETESFYFGNAYEPNYSETFDNANSATPFIKVNLEPGSYNPWEWDDEMQAMICYSSFTGQSDSWLISPPIHLQAGYTYFVKYDVITPAAYEEKLEVKWGLDANEDVTKLTEVLMPTTTYPGATTVTTSYVKEITVGPEGNYNFGFHSLSGAASYFVAVDNFRVELGPLPSAPDSVTNVSGETEPSGLDQAFITFTAPTKNRKGEPITSLDKIVVKSGERVVATISPVEPGKQYTAFDKEAIHGENTYDIFAYNENGVGQQASITIKVGQDKPGELKGITVIDQLNSVKLSWEAPEAAEGGVINPAGITYQVHFVKSAVEFEEVGQTPMGVTEYTVEDFKTFEGPQYIAYWGVTPRNASGGGKMKIKSMLVGKPYQMPHHRSFVNGTDDGLFMTGIPTADGDAWTMLRGESSDNDNGCIYFDPQKTGSSMIMLGKVSLRGAVKPQLIFDYKCAPFAKRKMVVVAQPMNGAPERLLFKDFSTIDEGDGWRKAIIDLPKELTKVNYISFNILGEATEEQPETPIYVDNIHFVDPLPVDASVELITPKTVNKGHKMEFNAKVTNLGNTDLDANTEVKIYVNGTVVDKVKLTKTLKTTDFELLPVTYQTSLNDEGTEFDVKAEVVSAGDVERANNISETVVAFADATMPKPENVVMNTEDPSKTTIEWQEPQIETPTVTEDFESYAPWSTTMDEWTLIDMDKGYAVTLDGTNFNFPHNREQFAFLVARPEDYPDNKYKGQVQPHSGSQMAMSFIQVPNLSKAIPIAADNWIISPPLPGKAQTINFWVKNAGKFAETFEVRYSTRTNPTDIIRFLKIGDTYSVNTGQWTNVTVDLPEGARFFAIHQNTPNTTTTMFMLDDITFTKGNTPVAYNIYRDGVLVGNTSGASFADAIADGEAHEYSVTAVYAGGLESEPVAASLASGIISTDYLKADTYNVYTLDGVQVLKNAKTLNSLKQGVYVINGKKVVINK